MQDINTLLQSLGIGQPQSANITGVGQDGGLADILASLSDNGQQDNYLSSYDASQEAPVIDFGDMQPMDYGSGGMGGGESYVPENRISNHIQQLLGAQEAPQSNSVMDILSNRFSADSSGPSIGDYSQAIQNSAYGKPTSAQSIADASSANKIKLMASMGKGSSALQAAQLGGARGGLIAQYMSANPGASFNDALAATSPLLGQGIQMQNGQASSIPGVADAAGAMAQAKATGRAIGTGVGEDTVSFKRQLATYPRLQQVVSQLGDLAKTATYTKAGQAYASALRQAGQPVPAGMEDRIAYQAVVRNEILPLLRQTFGAQFTEAEGMRLETTLGDPNLSPPEKQAALDAFIDSKKGALGATAGAAGINFNSNQLQQPQISAPNLQDQGFLQFLQSKGINVGQ